MANGVFRLADLPTEICDMIRLEFYETEDQMNFSLVCKRFRELSISSLFYSVSFPCSKYGLESLQQFANSNLCHWTMDMTFWMPIFLKPKVLDLEHFLSVMMTPEAVADIEASDGPDNVRPRFEGLHQVYRKHYEDTREIVNSDIELTALSSALRGLPRLTDLIFDFTKTLHAGWEHLYKWRDLTLRRETFQHHIPILSRALSDANAAGRRFESLRLVGFSLTEEDHDSWADSPETFNTIRQSLKQMFADIGCIRISRSPAVLRLCSRDSWTVTHIQLTALDIPLEILREFLTHHVALRVVGVYHVWIGDPPHVGDLLTPEKFVEMFNRPAGDEDKGATWRKRPHDWLVWEMEKVLPLEEG
ncbi:hypothetical protein BJY04DRAFT_213841 [Aspergillus karnatakaensis]|uniref:F-box protein n=1 Tax=Aspergillus karnatakaensis TaxID=1810916 RepID=UPI003CCE1F65